MHLMMITQTREQVSVQVISTLALQVQLKHKELNYHLIMYNLSTILPTFQTPHISQSDNHCHVHCSNLAGFLYTQNQNILTALI